MADNDNDTNLTLVILRRLEMKVDTKFEDLSRRIERLDGRVISQTEQFVARFDRVESSLVNLAAEIHVLTSRVAHLEDERVTPS